MIKNTIKLSKSSIRSVNFRFVSQTVKSDNVLTEEQKQINRRQFNDKSVSEKQNNELDLKEVVKSEEYIMDRIWELNQSYSHKLEHHKITDPAFEAHRSFSEIVEKYLIRIKTSKMGKWSILDRTANWIQYREENQQKYVAKRHAQLGKELAVANFVVVRGGRVRFKHAPDVWATHLDHFPDKYDPRYEVLSVDASNTKLRFEGIDNFQELYSLKELDLSDNKLDDWSCDKIGRMFRYTNLRSLNLSNNPLITERGIETLHRVRSLRTLNISGTKAAKYPFLELLILSFNDLIPDCHIIH